MVIVPALLLVTVMVLGAVVAPTPVAVKVSEVGLMVKGTVGPPVAVPASATICGLNAALVVTASAPLIEPLYCGVKVTMVVQLPAAESEAPQVPPVTEKSALAAGLKVMVVVCSLVTVTVADEVCPTAVLGSVRLVALNFSGTTPVPVSFTSCGLVLAPSLNVSAPVIAAATLGLKVTFTVQLLLAARELEQLLVALKSPLATIEVMGSAPVPELVRVTVFDALVAPAARSPKAKLLGLTLAVGAPPPELINT